MISVLPIGEEEARRAMTSRGGFLWWYLDLTDRRGNGAVVIWSYGLPFLPGYAEAARRGRAPRAEERPSLNVAVYEEGELDCYLLQEYSPDQVEWEPASDVWIFGESRLRRERRDGSCRITADLDCPVPGASERLRGELTVTGTSWSPASTAEHGSETNAHRWEPLALGGTGSMGLEFGDRSYEAQGRGYHDANGGTVPLHELGIRQWMWGRVPLPDRELIYYILWSDDDGEQASERFIFEVGADGSVRRHDDIEVSLSDSRVNLGGMRWWRRLALDPGRESGLDEVALTHRGVVDSGPFYMRFLSSTDDEAAPTPGFSELIRPHRVDLGRHRPLVRMRVHDAGPRPAARNSMWLPLFTGPKKGRLARLIRYNLAGTTIS